MTKGGKKTQMRRKRAPIGKVSRGAGGSIEMITLKRFRDNPLAPTVLVSDIGGIYRVNTHLIRCTFVDDVPNAEGALETIAQGHLVWKTEQNWLNAGNTMRWIMSEFRRGMAGIAPRMQ